MLLLTRQYGGPGREAEERATQVRDIFGDPFRVSTFDPAWRTADAAGKVYAGEAFGLMPILADSLQEAGYGDAAVRVVG